MNESKRTTNGSVSDFEYIGLSARQIREVTIVTMVTGLHTILIGESGIGKTEIPLKICQQVFGNDKFLFVPCDPTMALAKLEGLPDPAGYLESPPVLRVVTEGTPLDPKYSVIMLDEFSRSPDPAFDFFLHVFDKKVINGSSGHNPTIIATANYLPKGERTVAILDRIKLYVYVPAIKLSSRQVGYAHMWAGPKGLSVGNDYPTTGEIEEIQSLIPTKDSANAVGEVVDALDELISTGLKDSSGKEIRGFNPPHQRQQTTFSLLLFRMSAYLYGTNDFDKVHPDAIAYLKYAWTNTSEKDFKDWEKLVGYLHNRVGVALDAVRTAIIAKIMDAKNDGLSKTSLQKELASMVQKELYAVSRNIVPEDSPEYQELEFDLNQQIYKIVANAS